MDTYNQCQFAHIQKEVNKERDVIFEKKKNNWMFKNWEQAASQGAMITAVCHKRHKAKSNDIVTTSATPDWLISLPTSLMWLQTDQ